MLPIRYAGVLMARRHDRIRLRAGGAAAPIGEAMSDPQRYAEMRIDERNDVRPRRWDDEEAPLLGHGPGADALFHQDYRAKDDRDRAR